MDTIVSELILFKKGSFAWFFGLGLNWKIQNASQTLASSTLLKFIFGLADSLKKISNWKHKCFRFLGHFNKSYVYGDTLATMEFTTHKVNSLWSPILLRLMTLPNLQYEPEDIGSQICTSDTLYSFHLR